MQVCVGFTECFVCVDVQAIVRVTNRMYGRGKRFRLRKEKEESQRLPDLSGLKADELRAAKGFAND